MTEPVEPLPWLPVVREEALARLRDLIRIRRFEERCAELYPQGRIRGFLHLYIGEEACAVGALAALGPDDAVLATYREHGHAIARGVPMGAAMAEMFGRVGGCSRGRGGSMHLFDASRRFLGGNAIVAGHLPISVGVALADRAAGRPAVTACFFGEGAMAEGEFHEAMNLAALWRAPVVFLCENNGYAMGTALGRSESNPDLVAKAEAYGMPAEAVDGMDVLAVEAAVRRVVARVRGGAGPAFVELRTYRFRAHSMFDPQLYRDKAEVERWKARDPIRVLGDRLRAAGWLDEAGERALDEAALAEVDAAVAFAEASPFEPVGDLLSDVTSPRSPCPTPPPRAGGRIAFRDALREAIREILEAYPEAFVTGEDVGAYGGSYAVTKGLLEAFGPDRVRDAPLSEAGFTGVGVGAALAGAKPIVEIMTVNFSLLALDQLLNHAATLRHMSGGQLHVPLVVRMATGAGRQLAAQHSHSLEGFYAHVPGLRVVAPGTVEDARGMLWTAIHEPDPVIVFEHVQLYGIEAEIGAVGPTDLDRAMVRRPGRDVTLLAWGGCLPKIAAAAERLAAEGIEAEVVDVRVLRPLDVSTLAASVRRTRRAVVVDEAWRTGGFAAELAARLTEEAFWDLDAPIARVASAEVPIPYPKHLEDAALPSVEAIVAAARRTVRGGDV